MSFLPIHNQPPRLGAWLLSLFASGEEKDLLLGDLSEEYFQCAAQSGAPVAGRWYWWQTLKSLPHLIGSAFRLNPWKIALAVAAGFAFRKLIARLPEAAILAFIDRFQILDHHFDAYRFLTSTGIDIGHLLTFLLVGSLVALIARRSEMPPAITLGLIYAGMALLASVMFVYRSHEYAYLWRMSWYLSDALAIVVGAGAVRMMRADSARPAAQA